MRQKRQKQTRHFREKSNTALQNIARGCTKKTDPLANCYDDPKIHERRAAKQTEQVD